MLYIDWMQGGKLDVKFHQLKNGKQKSRYHSPKPETIREAMVMKQPC